MLQTTTPIRNGTDTVINSYDSHEFLVRFRKDVKGVSTSFKKGPREEVVTIYYDEKNGMTSLQTTKLDDIQAQIHAVTSVCSGSAVDFGNCVATGLLDDMTALADSKAELAKYRDLMSDRLRNYTCADEEMQTSAPLETKQIRVFGAQYDVNSYLDMPNAKIWTVTCSLPTIIYSIYTCLCTAFSYTIRYI